MRQGIVLLACVLAATIAACGDSASNSGDRTAAAQAPVPHFANDEQRADWALLPRDEVPAEVKRARDDRNRATCSPRVLFRDGATAMRTTPRFKFEGGSVQQTVALFRDTGAAERAFGRLDSSANRRCIERYTYDEIDEQTGERVPQLTEQILNLEAGGEQSSAFRLSVRIVNEAVAADILFARVGRGISSVSVTWRPMKSDFAFHEALAARIGARLERALGAQPHARPM